MKESSDYKFYLIHILYICSAYEHIVLVQYREVAEVCKINVVMFLKKHSHAILLYKFSAGV